jgi:hypothetical protein
MPSIFQSALATDDQIFAGPPFPATLHKHLFKVLRTSEPQYAAAAGVSIGRRVVNIVYGHRTSGLPLDPDELTGLSRLCDAATAAYIRMITSSKRRRKARRKAADQADGAAPDAAPADAPDADADASAGGFEDESTVVGKRSARKSGELDALSEAGSDIADGPDDADADA